MTYLVKIIIMIASCIIFLATLGSGDMPDDYYIDGYLNCKENVPESMHQYSDLYYKFFDEENISTAVKIGWCESRGKTNAYRNDNGDSGVMQFVPWTWNWIAKEYDLPEYNHWEIFYKGEPYTKEEVSKSSYGFNQEMVQLSSYYNIMFASLLAEDIYNKTQWKDWNSSKWCWEDENKWTEMWKGEQYG